VYAQVTALSEQVFKLKQVPQLKITGSDYALAQTTASLAGAEPRLKLATRPTHVVTGDAELLVQPTFGARRVRKLDAKTPVTLVRTDDGWDLVAKDGRPIGYVAESELMPIQ
jgi:hypothetical protein